MTQVVVLFYVPKNAFDNELVVLGIFSNVGMLKDVFYENHSSTTMLYNADNSMIPLPTDDYYYYEIVEMNKYL